MKIYRFVELSFLTVSLAACVSIGGASAKAEPGDFRYDAATGKCRDGDGQEGYNAPDPATLFAQYDAATSTYVGGDAECVDFASFDFSRHIGLGYPLLDGWSFKGARFDKARFFFANIARGDFAGADLRGLAYGYARIEGQGDAHTRGDACPVGQGYKIRCFR